MRKNFYKISLLIVVFCLNFFVFINPIKATSTTATTTSSPSTTTIIKKTKDLNPLGNLKIEIPGIKELAEKYPVKCSAELNGEVCRIPWIAIYIYAIYNYMLAVGGMLAVVTIMIGGIIWLISAGNASRISTAKSWISGSLTGLLILLTSYILLYQINPEMVDTVYIELVTIDPFDLPEEDQVQAPDAGPSSHGVPSFFQCSEAGKSIHYSTKTTKCLNDKGEEKTLCSSGCGILSTFMAVNKYVRLTDLQAFTTKGIELGARLDCNNGSYVAGLIKLAQNYGLESGYLADKDAIAKKLDQDCVVIISVSGATGSNCKFTNGGHYIVLTGWRDRTKEIVDINDPAGRLNSVWVNGYVFRGECAGYKNTGIGNSTAPCKSWMYLSNWGGCTLGSKIYVCNKK